MHNPNHVYEYSTIHNYYLIDRVSCDGSLIIVFLPMWYCDWFPTKLSDQMSDKNWTD